MGDDSVYVIQRGLFPCYGEQIKVGRSPEIKYSRQIQLFEHVMDSPRQGRLGLDKKAGAAASST